MIETIKKAITELNRDKEVIEPLRKLLDKGLVTVDYVRALEENNKISKTELFKVLSDIGTPVLTQEHWNDIANGRD
jgi:hypothetical protein